ncbi:methyl-accepting chemotaxis protein [Thiomicrospira microaerophila]|uniref:methyl-accepting chemotaxis protein n=1 Tax=Thiomicrospira microaerophila TaxID=406020 RepID=UPI000697200D|nr:methyl-accepting chemotaxis protein [Thiomicrospira microaerophila]
MFCFKLKSDVQALEAQNEQFKSILAALDKSNAVIEFTPSGEILNANDNFLNTVGYRLDEIRGKHHRIFVPQDIQNTKEYQVFWQTLAQGEFMQQRFKRINKRGEIVWIEASYNPVFKGGKVVKIVKYATNITEQVNREMEDQAKTNALDRSMAVIEFKPDGTILTANKNFCDAVGYSLREIQGKHHRIFVRKDYAAGQEYQDFWAKLSQGKVFSGQFDRIRKNGDTIWIEASYNPIFGADGEVVKVVKYASDITARVREAKLLEVVVMDTSKVLNNVASGRLSRKPTNPWDISPDSPNKPHLETLYSALNEMSSKLMDVVSRVSDAAEVVSSASSEVAQGASELSQRVQEQAASLEETSSAMEQMNTAVQNNTQNAQDASALARAVVEKADKGTQVMEQTIKAMAEIQASSYKISDIVSLIDGIAFQTNLLALNAAVEAARAGEHGRGFAVVAGEVRALAQKSAEAAKDIKKLISESVSRIDQGTKLASDSGAVLGEINEAVQTVTGMIEHIAQASKEQAQGVGQVHRAISSIDQITQQNAALVEETSSASEAMSQQAVNLTEEMRFFKVKEGVSNQVAALRLSA